MKIKSMMIAVLAICMGVFFTACSDDKNENKGGEDEVQSALVCVEQIIDGCMDIANEVGNAKIGDPYDLYQHGQQLGPAAVRRNIVPLRHDILLGSFGSGLL